MEVGTFEWALGALAQRCKSVTYRIPTQDGQYVNAEGRVAFRHKLDENGESAWRRHIFRTADGVFERWPSGRICPFIPCQEDMLATDWKLI